MEALRSPDSNITSIQTFSKDIKFKKETLIEELLSLGHTKITPQIAELIGSDVEAEIAKKKHSSLTSEFISELVAEKLTELGLIKQSKPEKPVNTATRVSKTAATQPKNSLSEEVLEVLSPKAAPTPVQIPLKLYNKEGLNYAPAAKAKLENAFCYKNEKGELIETAEQFFSRVARAVAEADAKYDAMGNLEQIETNFYNMMATGEFLPDTSILNYAGKSFAQLFSSYALLVRDTTESIFETMKQAALLHKSGARAVISFSQLRPSSDMIASTQSHSSGPVAFMKIFDAAMNAFVSDENSPSQDGVFLNVDHPDIFNFISEATVRKSHGAAHTEDTPPHTARFKRFVGISESFMKAVRQDADFALINPRRGVPTQQVRARKLFKHLVSHICKTGEPGLVFLDRLEATNPTPKMGFLVATSADGSQAFLPYETSANGFINLNQCVLDQGVDWEKIKRLVHRGVHFLENTLEISSYPFPENAETVKRNRKIGLGVMGWASMLEKLNLSYDSEEALELAEKIMAFIESEADSASIALAHQRGSFPNYNDSPLSLRAQKRRHATVTALANSERISEFASCSVSILPLADTKPAPDSEWCLRMQAAFQHHTENGVYLPIDLAKHSSEEEVAKVFILAHQLDLKSVLFRKPQEASSLRLVHGSTEDKQNPVSQLPEEKPSTPVEDGNYFTP